MEPEYDGRCNFALTKLMFSRTITITTLLAALVSSPAFAARDLRHHLELGTVDYALLGEVHDNERLHSLRFSALNDVASLFATTPLLQGRKVALALEQFDVARQADLDQFVAGLSPQARQDPGTAKRLAQAAGFSFKGWAWEHYEPSLQLALRLQWKILATNITRDEAMAIARGAAFPLLEGVNPAWTTHELASMAKEMQDGHCGLLPERAIPGMVKAQQARDAQMAKVLTQAMIELKTNPVGGLVIFLAGNGHVRKDLGVPRYLRALNPLATILTWGFVEEPRSDEVAKGIYDEVVSSSAALRQDPCEGLRDQSKNAH
jgi:uncharacterized iron-regulated protein